MAWDLIGQISVDSLGNLIITNDPASLPVKGVKLATGYAYDLDGDALDENDGNGAAITATGEYLSDSPAVPDHQYLSGKITRPITTDTNVVECFNKSNLLQISDTIIDLSDGTTEESNAAYCNANASTSWGLTSAQVAAGLWEDVIE